MVGQQVVDAIRSDTFLLATHEEVHDILVERSRDPASFLQLQIDAIRTQDEAAAD